MGTLVIEKTYIAGDPLMEVDIDAYRNGLLALFNTNLLGSTNFSGSTALTGSNFSGSNILPLDNDDIHFGSGNDAFFGIDSDKALFWNTAVASTDIRFYAGSYYMEFTETSFNVPSDIIIGSGGSGKTILQALSLYKKPVLEYNSSTSVHLQANTSTANETVIYFPNFIAAVTESSPAKYRYAAVSATANGYGTAHAGAALGGMRVGVTLTANNWYYVYAVGLRSGSDYSATTARFVMVFDNTAPTSETTLNTNFGEGNWVYLGLIRYGFGATGISTNIIPFKYSNKGWCSFYESSSSGFGGLNLAYTSTDDDNTVSPLYEIAHGTSGNVIPAIVGHLRLSLNRARVSNWWIEDSSGDVVWRGGYQNADGTLAHGFLIELVNDTGYDIHQTRISSNAGTIRGVCLAGFCDSYLTLRRQGHGI